VGKKKTSIANDSTSRQHRNIFYEVESRTKPPPTNSTKLTVNVSLTKKTNAVNYDFMTENF